MYRARGRPRCLGWVNRVDFAMSAIRPTESTGHAWLHSRCWTIWHVGRNIEAATFLAAMGIAQMPHSTLQISIAGTSPAARGKTGIRASPTGVYTAEIDSVEVEAFADSAAGSDDAASGSVPPDAKLDWPPRHIWRALSKPKPPGAEPEPTISNQELAPASATMRALDLSRYVGCRI